MRPLVAVYGLQQPRDLRWLNQACVRLGVDWLQCAAQVWAGVSFRPPCGDGIPHDLADGHFNPVGRFHRATVLDTAADRQDFGGLQFGDRGAAYVGEDVFYELRQDFLRMALRLVLLPVFKPFAGHDLKGVFR